MSKLLSISFILLFFVQIGFSQQPSVREWLTAADSAYKEGNYPAAFQFYDAALKYRLSTQDSITILYKYAESARQFNAFVPAEKAYQTLVDKDGSKQYPLSVYWLAVVEQQQEKYEEAELHYEQFLQLTPTPDSKYQLLAQRGLENSRQARSSSGLPQPIAPTRLAQGINNPNAEYVADFLGDTMIYSTLNEIYKKDTHKPPRKYTKLHTSVAGQAGKPWEELNEPGRHVSNLVFNRDQTRMYYTVCEYKENSVIEVRCDLYLRQREENGTWGAKKKLAINTADSIHTTTQPTIAYDAANNRELLFFVSDRPTESTDTTKNLNIWVGTISSNGEVASATPVNALNTIGNEASPYFYAPTQTLYFSSDGHSPNYGGFDVYEADMTGTGGWTDVKALNKPINSGYDELHFVLKDSKVGTDAYFSSNMPNDTIRETYVDESMKACCWDIFMVDYEIKLLVRTLLASNGTNVPLNGSTLSLYIETPTGNKLDTTLTQTNTNTFFFTLLPNKKYVIVGKHPNFNYEQTATIDPIRTEYIGRDTIKRDFIFAPVKLLVHTFKLRNGEPLDNAQVVVTSTGDGRSVTGTPVDNNTFAFEVQRGKQYQINGKHIGYQDETTTADLTSAIYRDSTQIERNLYFRQELEVLVCDAETGEPLGGATVDRKLLTASGVSNLDVITNPTDNSSFLYGYDKFDMRERYRITVNRNGYESGTLEVAFTDQQIQESNGKFVVRICLNKRDFLPITLYFDNDVPGPQSRTITTTPIAYEETYEDYYRKSRHSLVLLKKRPAIRVMTALPSENDMKIFLNGNCGRISKAFRPYPQKYSIYYKMVKALK
jgi:hypothetical protein